MDTPAGHKSYHSSYGEDSGLSGISVKMIGRPFSPFCGESEKMRNGGCILLFVRMNDAAKQVDRRYWINSSDSLVVR